MSESKIEEIIATLWVIVWAILWVNNAPTYMVWAAGGKAITDYLCVLTFAIEEIRSGK